MEYKLLSEVSVYRKDRIGSDKVNKGNYISTENMLSNRGGVENATTVASAKTFPAYKKGDILLSNIRPYFKKIWYATQEGGCSNDVLVVKAGKTVDSKFLYYVLSDNNFFNYSTVTSKGTKMPRGSKNAIMKYWVPNLDLPTQKKIADILSSYDKLINSDKQTLNETSPLQKLQNNLRSTFFSQLEIEPFSEDFHTVLKIYERKLIQDDGELIVLPKSKYTPRDIITQGSGYLQWLSIFSILYSSNIDILLLDEPDAHLHASLQSELLNQLRQAVENDQEKQILVSTHSVEMIKQAPLEIIFSMDTRKYLSEETSRVATLAGIGSEYFPKIDLLKRYKRLIFVENESDKKILSILGNICGITLPDEIVYWANTDDHATRRRIFDNLKAIIPDLKCVSLRDRDMDNPDVVGNGLKYKAITLPVDSPILLLQWRRKNIESYLLCPRAIAEAAEKSVEEVKQHIQQKFALAIDDDGYAEATPPDAIITCDGKKVFTKETDGLEVAFGCNKYDVAKKMTSAEVPEDIKVFLTQVKTLFSV